MRAVIQRVKKASVTIDTIEVSDINSGLLIFLGIENDDTEEDISWLVNKIHNMRIFNDSDGKMNLSIADVGGKYLVVSQFTLYASTKKGNRPSFIKSAKPEIAIPLYEKFISTLSEISQQIIKTGIFGADMDISLINDGPVTIIIDSKNRE